MSTHDLPEGSVPQTADTGGAEISSQPSESETAGGATSAAATLGGLTFPPGFRPYHTHAPLINTDALMLLQALQSVAGAREGPNNPSPTPGEGQQQVNARSAAAITSTTPPGAADPPAGLPPLPLLPPSSSSLPSQMPSHQSSGLLPLPTGASSIPSLLPSGASSIPSLPPSHQSSGALPSTTDAAGIGGLKLPVTCCGIGGVACMDQQIVSCYCESCEGRVAVGHARPIFSFTRFERHCGSKAKKWRLSIRIRPGTVAECPPGAPPMAIGSWLDRRGLMRWGSHDSSNIAGVGSLDGDDGMPLSPSKRPAETELPPSKRHREVEAQKKEAPTQTVVQTSHGTWMAEQQKVMDAAQKTSSGDGLAGQLAKMHEAIFGFVHGVLKEERKALEKHYLPWLNELSPLRLQNEFCTLHGYTKLAATMEAEVVFGMAKTYLEAVMSKASEPKVPHDCA